MPTVTLVSVHGLSLRLATKAAKNLHSYIPFLSALGTALLETELLDTAVLPNRFFGSSQRTIISTSASDYGVFLIILFVPTNARLMLLEGATVFLCL